MNGVKFLGTSDEVTTCDCCGRKNLKSTVALSIEDADPVYYGVTCAARALKMGVKEVRQATSAADLAKAAAEQAERAARFEADQKPWFAYLEANGTGADTFSRIQSLGGYTVAREKFQKTLKV
jgi:hypothetical protein